MASDIHMTPDRAFGIASQWGSFMNSFDPGAYFYSFHVGDGRPVSEQHRADCIAYGNSQISRMRTGLAMGTVPESDRTDLDDLQSLVDWFKDCDLHPQGEN